MADDIYCDQIEMVGALASAPERLLLRGPEVAKLLDLGRSKVYDMMKRGELPVVRIGKAVRVPRAALLAWIQGHTHAPSTT